MRRYFACCIAVAVNFIVLAAANAESGGKWELEERRSFIFTLSYKQSTSINGQSATSELALLCDQRKKVGLVGAILIPYDGTFEGHQGSIPISIQKKSDEVDRSDLLQKWENGSEFLFLEKSDQLVDLIALLKEKESESDRSVHFYFPSGLDNDQQMSDHIVIDASGFAAKFAEFEKGCASDQ
jgi:hypothetical protein